MKVATNKIDEFKKLIRVVNDFDFLKETLSTDSDVDVYIHAIWLGYLDACRTFNNQKKPNIKDEAIRSLAEKLKKYVDGGCEFDHNSYCNLLVDSYSMHYGQAQKIVNMAFKYLFCITNDSKLQKKFDCCHMPLDGIMLEWMYRNITDENGKKILQKTKIGSWSKMNADSYSDYQSLVLNHFKGKKPLELDFEYWREMALRLAAEQYLRNFNDDEKTTGVPTKWLEKVTDQ